MSKSPCFNFLPALLRTVKILAGFLVDENKLVLYALAMQRDQLPFLILVSAGNADITVGLAHYNYRPRFCHTMSYPSASASSTASP